MGRVDQFSQFRHDEAEGKEEEETGDSIDDNGADHGLGNHDSRFAYFFTQSSHINMMIHLRTGMHWTYEMIIPVAEVA